MKQAFHLTLLTLLCVLVFVATGCDSQDASEAADDPSPTDDAAQPQTPPQPAPTVLLAQGLADWKPINFGGEGKVTYENAILNLDFGGPLTGVIYTGQIEEVFGESLDNYEITLETQRVEGLDMFMGLTFPVGKDGHVSFVLGGWGGAITGISSLDGLNASENETTKFMNFKQEQWYAVRIRVTDKKIECWLDDEQIVDVTRADYKEFDTHSAVEASKPFALFNYESWGAYRDLKVQRLK